MMAKQVLLGYCPIGKFVFSHEEALRFKGKCATTGPLAGSCCGP